MSVANTAIKDDNRLWGNESICLGLPGFNVQFVGLSLTQKHCLVAEFEQFLLIELPDQSAPSRLLTCQTEQLDSPLDIPIEELQQDNQYNPKIMKSDDVLSITGYNFLASFGLNEKIDTVAKLAVFEELELTEMSVIENFLRVYCAYNAVALSGAVLHSAGLVFDNEAIIFVGYSNVGKTTLTRKAYGEGATILSDDVNLILPSVNGFQAFKVPFTGEFGRTLDHRNFL